MTCVIGISDGDRVWIGGDSGASLGQEVRRSRLPKVFKRPDGLIIGYTDSYRMGQLLQYALSDLTSEEGYEDPYDFLVTVFSEKIRVLFRDYGFSKIESNRDSGGTFLLGYKGKLYSVYSDFQVNESSDDIEAIGAGREYALGAIKALERALPNLAAPDKIQRGLEVAEYFCSGVMGPFTLEVSPQIYKSELTVGSKLILSDNSEVAVSLLLPDVSYFLAVDNNKNYVAVDINTDKEGKSFYSRRELG